MRSDMMKVLTERPRRGSRFNSYHDVRRREKYVYRAGEDDPPPARKEGMRYPYGYEQKEFTDLIGPLTKFLHSRVGKPWRKVHSEICQGLKGRSTQQQHLLDHVERMVVTDLSWENGKFVHSNGVEFNSSWRYREFYVDPRDGCLKTNTLAKIKWRTDRKKIKEMEDELKTKEGQVFRRIDGIWYEITVTVEKVRLTHCANQTAFLDCYVDEHREHKRQLGTAELRQRGLEND